MSEPVKQTSSVTKILAIVGLVFLLSAIVMVGTCSYCVLSNPAVRKTGSLLGEAMKMGLAATKAPGTAELRAAGCPEAMVMDLRRMVELMKDLEAEGGKTNVQMPEEAWQTTLVVCQYRARGETISCEQVAKTYGAAVSDPPAEFGVVVRVGQTREEVCRGVFGPDGTLLREIAEPIGPESVELDLSGRRRLPEAGQGEAEKPEAEDPAAMKPSSDGRPPRQPAGKKPSAEKSPVEPPAGKKPSAEKSPVEPPAGKKPSVEKAPAKQPARLSTSPAETAAEPPGSP